MQNLIDSSYFIGERELGNLFTNSGRVLGEAASKTETELNWFIAKYQKDYLEQMFGEDLAIDLPAELQALVIDDTNKLSPIADYVYYFIKRAKATSTTAMGEKKLNAPNTVITSDADKMFMAMTDCINTSIKIHNKLYLDEIITVTIDNVETELSYLNDIYEKIDTTSAIFNQDFNMYSV